MFLIAEAEDFVLLMILFSLQGVGFGGIDMMCNCAVPELWGLRAQPWMQGMHTLFGIGAVLGPAMVGIIGYKTSFIAIAIASALPMVGLLTGYVCGLQKKDSLLSPDEQ
eukprot:gene6495-8266_t